MKNFLFLISLCLVGCGGEVNTKLSTVANQELAKYTFANEIERIKITQRCSSLEFAVALILIMSEKWQSLWVESQ